MERSLRASTATQLEAKPFLPQGTTTISPPTWQEECTPLRVARPYVEKCGQGTLAASFTDKVTFSALLCGSWSCATCRKIEGARLLDRLRRGMESRPDLNRILVTLTIDPSKFEAISTGMAYWDKDGKRTISSKSVRRTKLWSGPTPETFHEAAEKMSHEWRKFNDRLKSKAHLAKVEAPGYFRVIELHRNGWPHYHAVIEHSTWKAADIEKQVRGWRLGTIVHTADLSLDDAIGEVAPYLVSNEKKSNGSKAYQFAGYALPEGFRLHSSSKGFLASPAAAEEVPEHARPLKGHFHKHHTSAKEYGADSRIILNPTPKESGKPYRPPGGSVATGDGAKLYLLAQLEEAEALPTFFPDLSDLPY